MPEIKVLPQHLANQIAAGEVVERPASVIKELVENSIDAGAGRISVEIELGGRRLMKISDDGIGIPRTQAKLAFMRHATSKINTLNDLETIKTLGFRGEALASIAAVSKVAMTTKTRDEEIASKVTNTVEGLVLSDAARHDGTTIEVRDLFYNTPARRKFLRSQPTENYHIAAIVTHYALANPEIAFALTNNGRETIRAAPARSLKERAFQLFGKEMIESLVPVSGGGDLFLNVHGFVSAPRERRTSRDSQYFFINGRFVKDKVVSAGLGEGYRSVLPHGVYPVAFLFLDLPPEEVDVNVHPSKTEVRFRRAEAVKDVVATAVKTALRSAGIGRTEIPPAVGGEPASDSSIAGGPSQEAMEELSRSVAASAQAGPKLELRPEDSGTSVDSTAGGMGTFESRSGVAASGGSEQYSQAPPRSIEEKPGTVVPSGYGILPPVDSASTLPREILPEELEAGKIRPIGQLHESFIIASDDKGLLLIDQHVAHERILFDYYRKREAERGLESQNLLIPETLDLSPAQAEAFGELREDLEAFGFRLTEMSGNTVAIQSVPADLPAVQARNLFAEILETVDATKKGDADSSLKDDIAASLACKAAVKINMPLTDEKMQWMIDNLLVTSSPSTCPHGRPVILRLTMKDIERKFHRT